MPTSLEDKSRERNKLRLESNTSFKSPLKLIDGSKPLNFIKNSIKQIG
ncbi:MAG: hypothetical protein ACD_73C00657G0001 [uncultured bacterium]|nr:MAG: hypothetical protein ACD_73C00657G0001 [uncultured bacterium]